jgi:8-oxo-dGTP diphosphatase
MSPYDYPRPALTVDVAVFRGASGAREVLLIRRGAPPFEGAWALPGGFVAENEPLELAALRELAEETGLDPVAPLRQVGTYGDPGRDPRGWTVSVLFAVVLGEGQPADVAGGDDAAEAAWHPVGSLPPLAFDHALLVADALCAVTLGL